MIRRTTSQPVRSIKGQRPRTAVAEPLLLGRVTHLGFAAAWPDMGHHDFGQPVLLLNLTRNKP